MAGNPTGQGNKRPGQASFPDDRTHECGAACRAGAAATREVLKKMLRTVTAMFDSHAEAERAREALVGLGLDLGRISLHGAGEAGGGAPPGGTQGGSGGAGGLLGLLDGLFLPEADHAAYHEGLRRGGTLLTAEVAEQQVEASLRALDAAGAVDLDEREAVWRQEGWRAGTAAGAVTDPGSGGAVLMPGTGGMDPEAARMLGSGSFSSSTGGGAGPDSGGKAAEPGDAAQLADRTHRVRRREPRAGGFRARSYIIDAPLAEESLEATNDLAGSTATGNGGRGG